MGQPCYMWMPQIPNPMIWMEFPSIYNFTLLRVGRGGNWRIPFSSRKEGRNMEATNMRRSPKPKVCMYRSSGSASSAAAARDRVSFGIIISSFQPPIGLHKQKKKKKVMIRRNLNLSIRRFGGADNKGIPELLLLRDPKQQQQHLGCVVGEESSSLGMGDEEVKLKKQEDGSIEKKIEQGEEEEKKDLKSSASVPEPPSPPEKPLPGDCCGNGCIPCVWDTYNEQLEDYNNLLKDYNSQFKP